MSEIKHPITEIEAVIADPAIPFTQEMVHSLYQLYVVEKSRAAYADKVLHDIAQVITSYHPLIPQEEIFKNLLSNVLTDAGIQ